MGPHLTKNLARAVIIESSIYLKHIL